LVNKIEVYPKQSGVGRGSNIPCGSRKYEYIYSTPENISFTGRLEKII